MESSLEVKDIIAEKKDYFSAMFYVSIIKGWIKPTFIVFFACSFLFIFPPLLQQKMAFSEASIHLTAFFIISLGGYIISQLVLIIFYFFNVRKDPLFSMIYTLRLVDEGFSTENTRGAMNYHWADFLNFYENKTVFVFRTHLNGLFIIPKRFFTTEQAQNFGVIAREKIKKSKKRYNRVLPNR